MDFKEVVKKRYSCKKFDGRKAEKDALLAILEAGRLAPLLLKICRSSIFMW